MNKIEKLIEKLCPDGVEYKKFGEVAIIQRGASPRPIQKFLTNNENGVPWIKIGDTKTGSKYVTNTAQKITVEGAKKSRILKKGDFILSNSMSYGRPYILNINGAIHDGWASISDFKDNLDTDFLYHFLTSKIVQEYWDSKINSGSVSNLNADIIKSLRIPVPPLAIQEKIVEILDKFTQLETELETELEARKAQYQFYRNQLLAFENKKVEWKTLGEITSLITKGTTPKNFTTNGVSFIKTESFEGIRINKEKLSFIDEITHNSILKRSILVENDILFTIAGATIGKCTIVLKDILPANTNQALAIIRLQKDINIKYIFYLLKSDFMRNYIYLSVKGSAQPNLNLRQLSDFKIPIPSISEQERIVKILDQFDDLVNDISIGLPAEIKARRQQYEFYREKLLTFKCLNQDL